MSVSFSKLQKLIVKNAPTILSIMGGIGTVTAVIFSSESALKASRDIKKAEKEKPQISKADKALIYASAYAPTAIMTAASLACIYGSNHINRQRLAGLASVYILRETAFKEYRDKAENIVGKKKAQQIKDDLIQDHISANKPTESNTCQPTASDLTGLSLWYDNLSGRYFYSSAERIRRAEIDANRILDKNGSVCLNDIYDLLDIPEIKMGDDVGWYKDQNQEVTIYISGGLTDVDAPCGVIDMDPKPNNSWFSEL